MNTILLSLALLPVVVLAIYVYLQDRQAKEPLGLLLKAFFFGTLSVLPALLMETLLNLFKPDLPVLSGLYEGFVVAGFSEELCKLTLLALAVWKSPDFDEYFDGIVYATFVSLGFACVENVQYVFLQETLFESLHTGFMRALLSVPGHFLFGVTMGYFFALAKFRPQQRLRHLAAALLLPVALHGTFDALLMIPETMTEGSEEIGAALFVAFLLFDLFLWKQGRKRLLHLQALSSQQASDKLPPFDQIDWTV